ncbi:MAG: hypothetical protein B7Y02_04275, partial [Rhodobacterales bacterium 17-64-5]
MSRKAGDRKAADRKAAWPRPAPFAPIAACAASILAALPRKKDQAARQISPTPPPRLPRLCLRRGEVALPARRK